MPATLDHITSSEKRPRSPRELTENTHPHLPDAYLLYQLRRAKEIDDVLHEDTDDLAVALERMAEIERDGVIPLDEFKRDLGL